MFCKNCNSAMVHVARYSYYGTMHFYRCPVCHGETDKSPLLSFYKTKSENIRKGEKGDCIAHT